MAKGDGTAATKAPKPATGRAHTSASMEAPPSSTRMSPGLGGSVGRAKRR